MLRQQFKQYTHHYHYMSISGKTTASENVLVMYHFRYHYCYHSYYGCDSYDVDALADDFDQKVLSVVILISFLRERLFELMVLQIHEELSVV